MMQPRGKIQSVLVSSLAAADPPGLCRILATCRHVRCIKKTHFLWADDSSSARHLRDPSTTTPYFQPLDPPSTCAHIKHFGVSIDPEISHKFTAWAEPYHCSQLISGTTPWSRRVLWILIRQTCEVTPILVHLSLTLSMSAYPDDGYHFTGCFSRGRRTPSSQGNGSHRAFFTLPPFASFRSSRPTGRLLSRILTTLVNFSFLCVHFILQPNILIPTIRISRSPSEETNIMTL